MLAARTSMHVESYESDYQQGRTTSPNLQFGVGYEAPHMRIFSESKRRIQVAGSFVGEDIERGQKTFRIVNTRGAIKTEPNEI
jgi:hypothetical protein